MIPAIDLAGGRVVRLQGGDFRRLTDYGDDPVAVAQRWLDAGARRLHLVDLDGARAGRPVQFDAIARIVASVDAPCQVGGGIRDVVAVAKILAAGADRVVMGTALLADPTVAPRALRAYGPSRIVAALDVRQGHAVGEGWRAGARGVPVGEALGALADTGIRAFAVTAIDRDGMLGGPDLTLLRSVRDAAPGVELIASGGVTTLRDVRALAAAGMDAAIVGRALYEERLHLREAIRVAESTVPDITERRSSGNDVRHDRDTR